MEGRPQPHFFGGGTEASRNEWLSYFEHWLCGRSRHTEARPASSHHVAESSDMARYRLLTSKCESQDERGHSARTGGRARCRAARTFGFLKEETLTATVAVSAVVFELEVRTIQGRRTSA